MAEDARPFERRRAGASFGANREIGAPRSAVNRVSNMIRTSQIPMTPENNGRTDPELSGGLDYAEQRPGMRLREARSNRYAVFSMVVKREGLRTSAAEPEVLDGVRVDWGLVCGARMRKTEQTALLIVERECAFGVGTFIKHQGCLLRATIPRSVAGRVGRDGMGAAARGPYPEHRKRRVFFHRQSRGAELGIALAEKC